MDDETPTFSVEMHSDADNAMVVSLAGDLDLANATWVEDCLAAVAPHHRRIEIALDQLTFLDSTGIRTLLTLRQRASLLRIEIALTNPSEPVSHALRRAGLLDIVDTTA